MPNRQDISALDALSDDALRRAVKEVLASSEFEAFATGTGVGNFPVAVASPTLQAALGTSARVVRFSATDRDKQVGKGHESGRQRYDLVQRMIDSGLIVKYLDQAVSLYEQDGEWFHAAIRVTHAGHELYLKSLRRADTKQIARDMARGTLVQDFAGKGRGAD